MDTANLDYADTAVRGAPPGSSALLSAVVDAAGLISEVRKHT